MITLKKGCLKQYDKASRRKTYYDNPPLQKALQNVWRKVHIRAHRNNLT